MNLVLTERNSARENTHSPHSAELRLKKAQDFASEQKSRFWDYFGNFLQCFTDFQKAVSSQPVEGFFRSAPEMKARDAYVPFLL